MKWLIDMFEPGVLKMASLRLISASLEFSAVILMLYFNDIKKALAVNSMLAVVGPLILILTTSIGLFYMADDISYKKLLLILLGVGLILYAIFK